MRTKGQTAEKKVRRKRAERTKFFPTRAMQAFLDAALDPDVPTTIVATARAAGIHPSNWRLWKRGKEFREWFTQNWREGRADLVWILDKIGIEKARKDFRYWVAMQKKYGGEEPGLVGSGFYVIVRAPRPERGATARDRRPVTSEQPPGS